MGTPKETKRERKSPVAADITRGQESLEKLLQTEPPAESRKVTNREIIQELNPVIQKLLKKGFRHEDIVKDLKGVGIGLTVDTLKAYLKPRKNTGKKKQTAERPEAAPVGVTES